MINERERPNTKRDESGCVVLEWWRESTEEEKDWNREYANECDRLSELEAVRTGKRHWGRWYLTKTSLVTRTSRPKVGESGIIRGGIYDIGLNRLNENWLRHMSGKNWIGEKALQDLAEALSALSESAMGNWETQRCHSVASVGNRGLVSLVTKEVASYGRKERQKW